MLYRVSETEVMDTLNLLKGIPHRNAFGETVILDKELCSTLIEIIEELRDIEESERIHMEEIRQLESRNMSMRDKLRKTQDAVRKAIDT